MLLAAAQTAETTVGSLALPVTVTILVVVALIVGAVMNPKDKKAGEDEAEVATVSLDSADDASAGN